MRTRTFLLLAALPASAWADGLLHRVSSVQRLTYYVGGGPGGADTLRGGQGTPVVDGCWHSTLQSGFITSVDSDELLLEWGDLPRCRVFTSFEIGYGTAAEGPIEVQVVFSINDNGSCDPQRVPTDGFRLRGLPGAAEPGTISGYVVRVVPPEPIDLSAAIDRDGDGYADFSYSYHFRDTGGAVTGPLLTLGDPNDPNAAVGAEDAWDLFVIDPADPPDPNALLIPGVNTECDQTWWWQFLYQGHMKLTRDDPFDPGCAPGCAAADFDASCAVDLTDLATLLARFGQTSGATHEQGDTDGDGDIDMSDLATVLARFGTDCNGAWHLFNLPTEPVSIVEGQTVELPIALASDPVDPVTVSIDYNFGGFDVEFPAGNELQFDSTDYFEPKSVTLRAVPDADSKDDSAELRLRAAGHQTTDVNVRELDRERLVLSTDRVAVPEGGTAEITIRLRGRPDAPVLVTITKWNHWDPDVTVSGGETLLFEPETFDVPQTVVFAAAEDADTENGVAWFSAEAPGYRTASIRAREVDND